MDALMKPVDPRMKRPIEVDQLFEQIQTKADKLWNELEVVSQNHKVREFIMVLYTTMLQRKAHPNDQKLELIQSMSEEQLELLLSEVQEKTIIIGR